MRLLMVVVLLQFLPYCRRYAAGTDDFNCSGGAR
jgi:hypothetical protein